MTVNILRYAASQNAPPEVLGRLIGIASEEQFLVEDQNAPSQYDQRRTELVLQAMSVYTSYQQGLAGGGKEEVTERNATRAVDRRWTWTYRCY